MAEKPANRFGFMLTVMLTVVLEASAVTSQQQEQKTPPTTPPPQDEINLPPEQLREYRDLHQKIKELKARILEVRREGMVEQHIKDIQAKKTDDALIEKLSREAGMNLTKVSYSSPVDGLMIPAYLFRPASPAGPKTGPALLWIHGGVHASFASNQIPLVHEAVARGYIVIAPDYRGSTGYGAEFYEAIDYGGYEVDDSMAAADYLKAEVPEVDPDRIGMIGWSHGGFITLHSLIRDQGKTLKCGYAGVPVTNLVFRLGYLDPSYEEDFVAQKRIGGGVYEKRDIYIERSPVYHVDKIKVPVRVHVSTNDDDVYFVEDQMLIHALEYYIPRLAETKIYINPPGLHRFDRLVNEEKTALQNTPAQRDSLNLIWAFLEEHLQPYR
jgi:dipeptidyl aminopeptidase/acylaminoacyl peptidase